MTKYGDPFNPDIRSISYNQAQALLTNDNGEQMAVRE